MTTRSKYLGSDELVDAILRVSRGLHIIPDVAVARVFALIRSNAGHVQDNSLLTPREHEVITHFANGKTYAQIAEYLGLSSVTIRNTIYRVQNKLNVGTKQEIVVWAVRNGLVGED